MSLVRSSHISIDASMIRSMGSWLDYISDKGNIKLLDVDIYFEFDDIHMIYYCPDRKMHFVATMDLNRDWIEWSTDEL